MTPIRVVHISDLHFGAEDGTRIGPLVAAIAGHRPDVVAVSGDLTQRALDEQFREARRFLDALALPTIVIPGNHDIPLYNVVERALAPRRRYRRWIGADTEPVLRVGDVTIIGMDTTRHYFWKDGRIAEHQLRRLRSVVADTAGGTCRMVMMHHPCLIPPTNPEHDRVGNVRRAMDVMAEIGIDVVLSGHTHMAFAAVVEPLHRHPIILSQAGTAVSTRLRKSRNTYNVIDVDPSAIGVGVHTWSDEAVTFVEAQYRRFRRHVHPGLMGASRNRG